MPLSLLLLVARSAQADPIVIAGGTLDFADLLGAVATVPGVHRLRFVTSYPRDFTPRMIEQVARHSNICPYLHLPVQSGSDRVLRRMGRGYTREQYLSLIADLCDESARPQTWHAAG